MDQTALFHDTIFDALGADIASAGGFKVVAGKLWPAENPTTAATKLRNAVNPDQAQKLCPEEVMQIKRLAHEAGSTATVQFESQQLGYRFEWIEPEDELTTLLREWKADQERGAKRDQRIAAAIEKAEARSGLRVVSR